MCDTCPKDRWLRNDVNGPFVALMFKIESWQLIAGLCFLVAASEHEGVQCKERSATPPPKVSDLFCSPAF